MSPENQKGCIATSQSHRACDVLIIGAGPTGMVAALEAADAGCSVVLVEKRSLANGRQGSRFQAVVLDNQSQSNLSRLGIGLEDVVPLSKALTLGPSSEKPEYAMYSNRQYSAEFPGSDSLKEVLLRREVSGVVAISDLEARLLSRCEQSAKISLIGQGKLESISLAADSATVIVSAETLRWVFKPQLIGVADGANSDQTGAMQILGVPKKLLAPPVHIAICRYTQKTSAGEVRLLTRPSRLNSLAVAFGMPQETIAYTGIRAEHQSAQALSRIAEDLAAKLRLDNTLHEPALRVVQQAKLAESNLVENRVLILGDAALSGTAALGVYLNKGISDARAFGKVCGNRASAAGVRAALTHFSKRHSGQDVSNLIREEQLVSSIFNIAPTLPDMNTGPLPELLARVAFRWKVKRGGALHTATINGLDAVATSLQGASKVAQTSGFDRIGDAYSAGARSFRYLQAAVE